MDFVAAIAALIFAGSAPAGGSSSCLTKSVEWKSGDFAIIMGYWSTPHDEIGEVLYKPTGKKLDIFTVNLGTDGKHGSWEITVSDRKCRDPDDCDLEGEIEVLAPASGPKEPPRSLRFIGLGEAMASRLKPGYWPNGAKPDDKFDLASCTD